MRRKCASISASSSGGYAPSCRRRSTRSRSRTTSASTSGFWSAFTTAHRSWGSVLRSLHHEQVFAYRAGAMDDSATPLVDVTFVVLDLETTGGSAQACAITEVGALKFKGGECLGTFQTLVNPGDGVRLPPEIVYLTGITEAMVAPAPKIESVLPAFTEFIGDAVIVGHNV